MFQPFTIFTLKVQSVPPRQCKEETSTWCKKSLRPVIVSASPKSRLFDQFVVFMEFDLTAFQLALSVLRHHPVRDLVDASHWSSELSLCQHKSSTLVQVFSLGHQAVEGDGGA